MAFRCQFIFNAGKNGWAETWYLTAPSSLPLAVSTFNAIVPSRKALCAPSVTIEATRVTDLSTPRTGFVTPFPAAVVPAGAASRDTSWCNITIRVADAAGTFRRTLNLRGVPDDWSNFDEGALLQNPAIDPLLRTFLFFGKRGVIPPTLAWRALDRLATNKPKPITAVVPDINSGWITITCAAHGLFVNDYCRLALIRGQNIDINPPSRRTVNGIWKVNGVIDANNFTIPVNLTDLAGTPIINRNGLVYPRNYVYPQPASFLFININRRQTGKAFFVPPGHSRALKQK
jgi:hypothetical protein